MGRACKVANKNIRAAGFPAALVMCADAKGGYGFTRPGVAERRRRGEATVMQGLDTCQ